MGPTTMHEQTWMDHCIRLVLQRVPDLSRHDARVCAEEMHRTWPHVAPGEAVTRYFEHPRFEETDWAVFVLR